MKQQRLVCGVGINDSDYTVQIKITVGRKENGKVIAKCIWACPFYQTWQNLLSRCYKPTSWIKNPTYIGCSVVPEWHYFMTFRSWMEKQDWKDKHLDKDLLVSGNKVYGPDTCLFLEQRVNSFMIEANCMRGEYPVGVCFHKKTGKFQANCNNVISKKKEYLGLYETPEEAHQAWLSYKLEQAKILASQQTDLRVAKALIERYENYVLS